MLASTSFMSRPLSVASYGPQTTPAMPADQTIIELEDGSYFALINAYHQQGLAGTAPGLYVRQSVKRRLEQALDELGSGYRFIIFDAFRSLACQKAIFALYYDLMLAALDFNADLAWEKTKAMVPYPDGADGVATLPHNSGGAVDLSLEYNGRPLDMGCPFDESGELAHSDTFEACFDAQWGVSRQRWQRVRNNRRLLFNLLVKHGFTNHPQEWWHFDYGNDAWATALACKPLYGSAEEAVQRLLTPGASL